MSFEIKGIQTDNGSRFLGEFTKALKKKDINIILTIQISKRTSILKENE